MTFEDHLMVAVPTLDWPLAVTNSDKCVGRKFLRDGFEPTLKASVRSQCTVPTKLLATLRTRQQLEFIDCIEIDSYRYKEAKEDNGHKEEITNDENRRYHERHLVSASYSFTLIVVFTSPTAGAHSRIVSSSGAFSAKRMSQVRSDLPVTPASLFTSDRRSP